MPVHLDLGSVTGAELAWLEFLDSAWVDAEFDAIVEAEWPNKPLRRPFTRPHRSPWWPRWTPAGTCHQTTCEWSTRLDPKAPRQRSPPGT